VTAPALPEGPVDFNTVVSELEKKLMQQRLRPVAVTRRRRPSTWGSAIARCGGSLRKDGYGRDGTSCLDRESGEPGETETSGPAIGPLNVSSTRLAQPQVRATGTTVGPDARDPAQEFARRRCSTR